ncbi:hypothetical protein [Enterococcus raffinosus]|uniref:hypothetical protein n=1 Tax=Enterococcus raffinosus TaxID=71452 RepID=UPI001E28643C|nr:hypothetical protein [Enterococcus raffinosus]UXK04551.1 hypothetical protein N7K38_01930 [Enterococcus raffinosus]
MQMAVLLKEEEPLLITSTIALLKMKQHTMAEQSAVQAILQIFLLDDTPIIYLLEIKPKQQVKIILLMAQWLARETLNRTSAMIMEQRRQSRWKMFLAQRRSAS